MIDFPCLLPTTFCLLFFLRGPVSRILFPSPERGQGGDHSSTTVLADGLQRPNPEASDGQPYHRLAARASLFGLAPGGVCLAAPVTRDTGELLPHLCTLTPRSYDRGAVCFCGTFRGIAPPSHYEAPCPVEFGLSSPPRSKTARGGDRPAP